MVLMWKESTSAGMRLMSLALHGRKCTVCRDRLGKEGSSLVNARLGRAYLPVHSIVPLSFLNRQSHMGSVVPSHWLTRAVV
jgi:hypothetical protein